MAPITLEGDEEDEEEQDDDDEEEDEEDDDSTPVPRSKRHVPAYVFPFFSSFFLAWWNLAVT